MVLIFANTQSLGLAIFIMVIFSSFVQAAEGSSYGIVPYVNPPVTGSIVGNVGAGGNTGAVCFGLSFRNLETKQAFVLMGSCIIGSGVLSLFIFIKGHASLITGHDSPEAIAAWKKMGAGAAAGTLEVPLPNAETSTSREVRHSRWRVETTMRVSSRLNFEMVIFRKVEHPPTPQWHCHGQSEERDHRPRWRCWRRTVR